MEQPKAHAQEVKLGNRFEFGANWTRFLAGVGDQHIESAVASLKQILEIESLAGKTFLDVGCGSGLFGLAARRLGAATHSFDFDPQSVACAREMKRRFDESDPLWTIEEGSALDEEYLKRLGTFDVVYSWGVLHHTGNMRKAIDLSCERVNPGGLYCIAIYNDQGGASRRWLSLKRLYNKLPSFLRPLLVLFLASAYEWQYAFVRLLRGRNPLPFKDWSQKKKDRGMSAWHDWVDWCGGLPFEVAKPEHVILPLRNKGFILRNLTTCAGGWGCNQYVFRRSE